MNILVSNDDGIDKKGLKVLAASLSKIPGARIYVVAPDRERSCTSHCLTMKDEIMLWRWEGGGYEFAEGAWACSGTPADCIKLGVSIGRKNGIEFDLVCTGINHGSNLGTDVHYSGTLGAAMEGLFMGVQAIGFSLCSYEAEHFEVLEEFIPKIVEKSFGKVPADTILSVNAPDLPKSEIKGVKAATIGPRDYSEDYVARALDDGGWALAYTSRLVEGAELNPEWDLAASLEGWITITPVATMRENPDMMGQVQSWVEDI